jgi:hypothetical protein
MYDFCNGVALGIAFAFFWAETTGATEDIKSLKCGSISASEGMITTCLGDRGFLLRRW